MTTEENITALWEKLHEDRAFRTKLEKTVAESWERSKANNIDANALPPLVPRDEIERIRQDMKKLRVCTSSILAPMFKRSPYPFLGALLFSCDGALIQVHGPSPFLKWASENHFEKGTSWSEQAIGTNVFSVGMKKKEAFTLTGTKSFSRFLLKGTYYFSPIALPDGQVTGGLVLAVPCEEQNMYLQSMADMAVRMIELQLLWFDIVDSYGDSSDGHGVIALDQSNGENRVLTVSKEMSKMFDIPVKEHYYEPLESFIDPLPGNRDFWAILEKGTRVNDKTMKVFVGGAPKNVSVSTSRFLGEKFHMRGLVVSFNSFQRINRLVSKYGGNTARYSFDDIIGTSPACSDMLKRSRIAAMSDSNVLLLGESGVGKDIIAQSIHNGSRRSKGPFVAINCAAFSKELIASELFGYESGAFTGAKKGGNIGKFELANNGTLFLDEIGDMPLNLQALLLRVIEERSFMKVGGTATIRVNVRIIAATNSDLSGLIKQGLFREDLFYRIGVVRIHIPPLRDRREDMLLLAEHFIPAICSRLEKPLVTLQEEAKIFFRQYRWPGNVRELQNLLEGIISTHNETTISVLAVRQYLGNMENDQYQMEPAISSTAEIYNEREEIFEALRMCRNNRTKAAEYLGMSRRTLYRRLVEYGLL